MELKDFKDQHNSSHYLLKVTPEELIDLKYAIALMEIDKHGNIKYKSAVSGSIQVQV
jgi:hypothetical protein